MTTVAQMIEWMKTLPPDADVDVCCEQASARAWQGYLDRQNGI